MNRNLSPAEISVNREFENIDQTIPESMSILDAWVKKQKGKRPFEGITALFIQHQFGNQVPQTKAMIDLGLDPEKLFWLDIPYTSNAEVRRKLMEYHVPKENLYVHNYNLLEPYGPYQRRRVQKIIRKLLNMDPAHLLVLDDGSYFLEALATMKTTFKKVSVVEQTSRGIFKINEDSSIKYCASRVPVVNVARSGPKMRLEPPFIGRSVCIGLKLGLKRYLETIDLRPVLLIGFGAIGRSVADSLTEYLNISPADIYVYDKRASRQALAIKRGFSSWNRNDFETTFGLVVGCTGMGSFKCGDYIYLNSEALLASASSGTVELSRQDFIELADSSDLDDLEVIRDGLDENNIHSDIKFRLLDRDVVFLNGGFPVNFSGEHVNCIPVKYMEPTSTLMVAAAVQAVTTKKVGLTGLSRKFCNELEKDFKLLLGVESDVLK